MNDASTPKWAPLTGVIFGAVTLLFFMTLVVLSVLGKSIPADDRMLAVTVLALGVGFASSFLGGTAAAEGHLPIPYAKDHPVKFSVAGGIAVFVIVMFIGWLTYIDSPPPTDGTTDDPVGLPALATSEIGFTASNLSDPFALKGDFQGTCEVTDSELIVHVSDAVLSYPVAPPAGGDRYCPWIRATLVRDGGNTWIPIRSSPQHAVNVRLALGKSTSLPSMTLRIPRDFAMSLGGCWIVFDMADGKGIDPGLSHAHTGVLF